jgi:pyruvate dehydrogenase E1 component beta subunit
MNNGEFMRTILYGQAINEALRQLFEADPRVFLMGQGVTSPWYVGATTLGLEEEFGDRRIIDTPVSENGVTGAAVGAAIAGMRPIVVHPRMDFMYYAMDQIANHAANWHYMFGSQVSVPLTIWSIINRGGEQAAQHSQALQAMFMHQPGLKVVMPSTPADAKGLLVAAVRDENPVVYIDDRWLYRLEGEVPEKLYETPIGKAVVRKTGEDVTIAATSFLVLHALQAADNLVSHGIDAEVVDLRTIKPLDEKSLLGSVRKTGRLVVADGGWRTCGVAAEISSTVAEKAFASLKSPVARVTLPDVPAPASSALERAYYPDSRAIERAVHGMLDKGE